MKIFSSVWRGMRQVCHCFLATNRAEFWRFLLLSSPFFVGQAWLIWYMVINKFGFKEFALVFSDPILFFRSYPMEAIMTDVLWVIFIFIWSLILYQFIVLLSRNKSAKVKDAVVASFSKWHYAFIWVLWNIMIKILIKIHFAGFVLSLLVSFVMPFIFIGIVESQTNFWKIITFSFRVVLRRFFELVGAIIAMIGIVFMWSFSFGSVAFLAGPYLGNLGRKIGISLVGIGAYFFIIFMIFAISLFCFGLYQEVKREKLLSK